MRTVLSSNNASSCGLRVLLLLAFLGGCKSRGFHTQIQEAESADANSVATTVDAGALLEDFGNRYGGISPFQQALLLNAVQKSLPLNDESAKSCVLAVTNENGVRSSGIPTRFVFNWGDWLISINWEGSEKAQLFAPDKIKSIRFETDSKNSDSCWKPFVPALRTALVDGIRLRIEDSTYKDYRTLPGDRFPPGQSKLSVVIPSLPALKSRVGFSPSQWNRLEEAGARIVHVLQLQDVVKPEAIQAEHGLLLGADYLTAAKNLDGYLDRFNLRFFTDVYRDFTLSTQERFHTRKFLTLATATRLRTIMFLLDGKFKDGRPIPSSRRGTDPTVAEGFAYTVLEQAWYTDATPQLSADEKTEISSYRDHFDPKERNPEAISEMAEEIQGKIRGFCTKRASAKFGPFEAGDHKAEIERNAKAICDRIEEKMKTTAPLSQVTFVVGGYDLELSLIEGTRWGKLP